MLLRLVDGLVVGWGGREGEAHGDGVGVVW